jgi:hypothetical protein
VSRSVGVGVLGVGPAPYGHKILAGTDDGREERSFFCLRCVAGGLINHVPARVYVHYERFLPDGIVCAGEHVLRHVTSGVEISVVNDVVCCKGKEGLDRPLIRENFGRK